MEWKIKYCTCMWCGISPLKEQGVTIPRIYPLYLGYHHTSLICHIISHYIVGGIFNPSVYPRMSLCFFLWRRRRRRLLTNFSLCTIQIALSAIFPFLTFSTCQLFYELLFFHHSLCFFFLAPYALRPHSAQTWQMMSALVHSFPESKAKLRVSSRAERKGKERKGEERRGEERKGKKGKKSGILTVLKNVRYKINTNIRSVHQVGRTRAWHVALKVFPMQRIPAKKSDSRVKVSNPYERALIIIIEISWAQKVKYQLMWEAKRSQQEMTNTGVST